jgi:hypothetical protein
VNIEGLDHLARWIDLVGARPAVQRGRDIPAPPDRAAEEAAAAKPARKCCHNHIVAMFIVCKTNNI